jgi:hypothetical protein
VSQYFSSILGRGQAKARGPNSLNRDARSLQRPCLAHWVLASEARAALGLGMASNFEGPAR